MNGLSVVNIELTSRCNKKCGMCGRRKMEQQHPELCDWGDMPKEMLHEIARQIPEGLVVQLHDNGEPLLYPDLHFALQAFRKNIRCFNTNGKLLVERHREIIGNMETLTISVIQNDPEGDEQYETVRRFIEKKGHDKPRLIYRLLGEVDNPTRWQALPGLLTRRVLHSPWGSRDYERRTVIPEHGICQDLLSHLAIDRKGNVSLCVRFDPEGALRIGRADDLEGAWNSERRKLYVRWHVEGHRNMLPGCSGCEYWGVPRG